MKTLNLRRQLSMLATGVLLASCGESDGDLYEQLDRLRVLAIRSEPPDLVAGQTARLSANVFEPEGRELGYEWSWCPSRGDADEDFECNVSERDLQRAWSAAGLDGPMPAYALGTDSEVQLTHVLTPELVTALCQAPDVDARVERACFDGLEASIELTVRSSEQQLTAIKSVALLMGESNAERNTNPASDFELTLRDREGDVVVESGEPLRAGHRYTMIANIDPATAESFTPSPLPGEPQAGERRETLVMSWFVSVGELADPDGDDDGAFGDDFVRTTFVDGSNELEDLLRNGWKIPLTAGSSAALHVVLRDERGGVGWATRSFDVVGGEQ